MMLTYQFRVKDASTAKHLAAHARTVNYVWNFCCATQRETERRWKAGRADAKWLSFFDLNALARGATKELNISSRTILAVCRDFISRRDAIKRCPNWRSSKKKLGWVPFIDEAISLRGDHVIYWKRKYRFWKTRDIQGRFRCGSFRCDARGRWYINFQCELPDGEQHPGPKVGIDLGLKSLAVMSDGASIEAPRFYRQHEATLAVAQRANNKPRVRAIHAKIANCRKHFLHVETTKLVRQYGAIYVGDVSSSRLAKTNMAKSIYDAAWELYKGQLRYKTVRYGAVYQEVNEAWTSVTCSSCLSRTGPRGKKGLRIRQWECSNCGAVHDRDCNSSKNILRVGLECQPLVGEIPCRTAGRH